MSENTLSLRFFGVESLKPTALRSREVGDVVTAIEDAVIATVRARVPDIKKEHIVVSLVGVSEGSVALAFSPNLPDFTLPAARQIVQAFAENQFRQLPIPALGPLRAVIGFVRRRGCKAEFRVGQDDTAITALITPETKIETFLRVEGETVIYGQVVRVGGVEPKVELKTIQGDTLYCDASNDIAKKLGEQLYEEVSLYGNATWDHDAFTLEEFRILRILPHKPTPFTATAEALREAAGDYFDQIEDVNRWVTELREEEDTVHGASLLGHQHDHLGN